MNLKFSGALAVVLMSFSLGGLAKTAYIINGKKFDDETVYKENQGRFYELEKKKYELIESIAHEAYLDAYFEKRATSKKLSPDKARSTFLDESARVSEAEIKATLMQYQDNPQLQAMDPEERKKRVTDFLKSTKSRDAVGEIVRKAIASGDLKIAYPRPKEPIFDLPLMETDFVKYGPKASDTKPQGCAGESCPITVIEYSEYQCPFCVKVLPAVDKLMKKYQGKVRWVVRDFPLGFHNRARPAAVAARCAGEQGKYWEMYKHLFENQRQLGDAELLKYGKDIGLDEGKYKSCIDNPEKRLAVIDKNYRSGEKAGVTGTPAFFINGRRLSGALPYEQFERIFEEELSTNQPQNTKDTQGKKKKS